MTNYMEYIQHAVDDAWEELHGAKHYAEIACKMRENDPSSVSMFSEMAKQELQHAEKLMDAAGRLSNSSGDDTIKSVWAWLHQSLQDKHAEITAKINMIDR